MTPKQLFEQAPSSRQLWFHDPLPSDFGEVLPLFLKQRSHDFLQSVSTMLSPAQHQELNAWYWSAEGQEVLALACEALWKQMSAYAPQAQPAHDARHAMHKVPAAALAYINAEQVRGWERVGVLGALLHDHGRWPEERIYGEPQQSQLHAQISFMLGQEWLKPFDMPLPVRQHILLAALRHTAGAEATDPMPLKLTVSADRDQLYGAEFVLRLVHHIEKKNGDFGSFYGENQARSVLDKIHHMALNRLPGPLFSRPDHVHTLWQHSVQFLLLANSHHEGFLGLFAKRLSSRSLTPKDLVQWQDTTQAFLRAHAQSQRTVLDELTSLLSAQHIAPQANYRTRTFEKLLHSPEAEKHRALAAALAWANHHRQVHDAAEAGQLKQLTQVFADDALLSCMLSKLTANK